MDELITNIEQWAEDKGILANSTPDKQNDKTREEIIELRTAMNDMVDALGDIQVTLVIQCKMRGLNFAELCMEAEDLTNSEADVKLSEYMSFIYQSISLMLYYTVSEEASKTCIVQILRHVIDISEQIGVTPEYCLSVAYRQIRGRTGKMVNGLFVKDDKEATTDLT